MKKIKLNAGIVLLILLLQGCALNVVKMDPQPNVNINVLSKSIALQLDDRVEDSFKIASSAGINGGAVKDWHSSLKSGFDNAFEDYLGIKSSVDEADLILVINKTRIEFVPTSIVAAQHGVGVSTAPGSARAQLTFSATLKESDGKVLGRVADTAVAKSSLMLANEATKNVSSAVESMYEIIAQRLFSQL